MSEIYIVPSLIGVFGVNEVGEIEEKVLFEKDVEAAAKALSALQHGTVTELVEIIVSNLRGKGFRVFIFDNPRLGEAVKSTLGVDIDVRTAEPCVSEFRSRLLDVAVTSGFAETPEDFNKWVREVTSSLTRSQLRKASARQDLQIVQEVLALDDLDKTLNLYATRVREWYGLHFPELGDLVDKHETYLRLITSYGDRSNFEATPLQEVGLTEKKSEAIVQMASDSLGAEVAEGDMTQIRSMSEVALKMYEIRRSLESHIEEAMKECAPNITGLVGSSIGARLLALAGGLERLARMPASTIQVLGAETALFRSLKTGSLPPKHGIIFQSPLIHQSERWKRGKIARALAGKLAIAARIDAFSDRDQADHLRSDLERRVEEIHRKYSSPPRKIGRKRRDGKG